MKFQSNERQFGEIIRPEATPIVHFAHLFGRRSSQIEATFIIIFIKCANIRRVLGKYYFINLCVSLIYEAGQKDSQVHTYNKNLQSTFLKMLKCNFAMFSIWQASTWQTGVTII